MKKKEKLCDYKIESEIWNSNKKSKELISRICAPYLLFK